MSNVSVVIPTFNRRSLIGHTVRSVLNQDGGYYEIIVVDDGSTDGTLDELAAFGDRIKILQQENLGPGAARNLGIQHASGEYIAFLDSDDLWFPWTLATYSRVITQYDRPGMIAGKLHYFASADSLEQVQITDLQCRVFGDYLTAAASGVYVGSGQAVVRRQLLLDCGGFVGGNSNAEDHDLALRLGLSGKFVEIQAPAMVAYRQHSAAATTDCLRTFQGIQRLLLQESQHQYPGGLARQRQRRAIIAHHARPVSLTLLKHGEVRKAWKLYCDVLPWHVKESRWKYLLGFPVMSLMAAANARPAQRRIPDANRPPDQSAIAPA